jgi:hypothetical protein
MEDTKTGFDPEIYNDSLFEPIRVGNIEARWSECNKQFEILKWFPNMYYQGTKEKFPNCHESCFKNPESCIVIAAFDIYTKYEPDVRSISSRIFDLDDDELKALREVGTEAWEKYKDVRSGALENYRIMQERQRRANNYKYAIE